MRSVSRSVALQRKLHSETVFAQGDRAEGARHPGRHFFVIPSEPIDETSRGAVCCGLGAVDGAISGCAGIGGDSERPCERGRSFPWSEASRAKRAHSEPRGLLIIDSVGHAFEFFTTASRQAPETPQADPLAMFNAYGGFWGGYRVDTAQKRITFKAQGAISIAMQGREFSDPSSRKAIV